MSQQSTQPWPHLTAHGRQRQLKSIRLQVTLPVELPAKAVLRPAPRRADQPTMCPTSNLKKSTTTRNKTLINHRKGDRLLEAVSFFLPNEQLFVPTKYL